MDPTDQGGLARALARLVVALVLGAPAPAACTPSILQGSLTPGSYAVGFRTLFARDTSRGWLAAGAAQVDPGRPVRISLWYPARPGNAGPSMRYGDYLHYQGPPEFRALDDTLEVSDRRSWTSDLFDVSPAGRELAARLFAAPVAAHRDAAPAPGRFPLLLYSGGLGSRADANAELGEFLASHGYVVATVPQLGPSAHDLALGGSPDDVLLHVQDLEFAARVLRTLAEVDPGPIAVAGHSAGGVVALELAMRSPDVAAVVGLDGAYGMHGEASRSASAAQRFPEFAPERVTAALLDLRRANGVQSVVLDSTVVAGLRRADRYVATFPRMYHGDFTEFAPVALALDLPLPANPDGRTRRTGYDGNQAAYHAILDFLEATLRHARGRIEAMVGDLGRAPGVVVAHERPADSVR